MAPTVWIELLIAGVVSLLLGRVGMAAIELQNRCTAVVLR
jgi:hypothetical protein